MPPATMPTSPSLLPSKQNSTISTASPSTATLGHSQLQSSKSNGTTTSPTGATPTSHQLQAFLDQDLLDDGTLHGRVPDHVAYLDEDSCIPFYEARAETAIAEFDAAFAGSEGR